MRKYNMATIREVLYQHIKGVSTRSIAKSFCLSRNTVKKYLTAAKTKNIEKTISDKRLNEIAINIENSLYQKPQKRQSSVVESLTKHKQEIESWLSQRNMTQTQIQRLLSMDGVEVSNRSINRFIKKEFPKSPKSTVHLITEPGQEGQVDFGYVGHMSDKDGKARKAYVFVMTLSHSRYRYVEFTFSQDQISWAQLHINAFIFFGGVPMRVMLDNLKAGVIKADIYDPTLNETYSELSRFYGFTIDPNKSYSPQHKGKVERSIRIVKEQLIAGKSYQTIEAANIYAKKWCAEIVSHRVCSSNGAKPVAVFIEEEKAQLLPIPSESFDIAIWTVCKVHNDHHFTVKCNFYSVPTKYIGCDVNVRVGIKTVSAYYQHKVIKTHPRNYGRGQWITDIQDYPKSALYHLANTPSQCLEKAEAIGEATYKLIQENVSCGSKKGLRKSQAILRLADKYGNKRLESACSRSNTYTNYSYQCLVKILEQNLDQRTESNYVKRIKSSKDSAYIRPSEEYTSDMEVNYA